MDSVQYKRQDRKEIRQMLPIIRALLKRADPNPTIPRHKGLNETLRWTIHVLASLYGSDIHAIAEPTGGVDADYGAIPTKVAEWCLVDEGHNRESQVRSSA